MLLLKPFWVTFLLSLNWIALSNCVKFTLPAYPPGYSINKRCLGLYIQPNTLVTGYINVTRSATDPFFRTNAWIDDSSGSKHLVKNDIRSEVRFSFKTHEKALDYQCCVVNDLPEGTPYKIVPTADIDIIIQTDLDLFDEALAHNLKVRPLEKEIMDLETVMSTIIKELDELHLTERNLRDTNESANDRVKFLSIISICALVGSGVFQLFYLRRYFKTKKLI